MLKFAIGVFVGLIVATFSPNVATFSRGLFDSGREVVTEFVEPEKSE